MFVIAMIAEKMRNLTNSSQIDEIMRTQHFWVRVLIKKKNDILRIYAKSLNYRYLKSFGAQSKGFIYDT